MKSSFNCIAALLVVSAAWSQPVPVKMPGGYGFQTDGRQVIAPQFAYATHFSEGLALVKTSEGWGYIDTTGRFVTPHDFTRAELLKNGFAYVYRGSKVGVIDAKGTFCLPPEYDSIRMEYSNEVSYRAFKNGLAAWCTRDYVLLTPAEYNRFTNCGNYVSGQKSDGSWDIYYGNKKVLAGVSDPVKWANYETTTELVKLKKDERYGIFHPVKGWVAPAVYDTIIQFRFGKYTIDSTEFDYVYILDPVQSEVIVEVEYYPTDFHVARADGSLISDQLFFVMMLPESWERDSYMRLRTANGMLELSDSLTITERPFTSLTRLQPENFLADLPSGNQAILDKNYEVVTVFDSIRPASNAYVGVDQNGDPIVTLVPEPYLAIKQVFETTNGRTLTALYDVDRKLLISPWLIDPLFSFYYQGEDINAGYIYRERNGKNVGFYFKGMPVATGLDYRQAVFTLRDRVEVDLPSGKHQLLQLGGREPKLLVEDDVIFSSMEVESYGRSEEEVSRWFMSTFNEEFICTQNAEGKLGFRTWNGVRIPDRFDSIGQNASMTKFVDVCEDGLYGAVNLDNGKIIDPFSKTPLTILFNDENRIYYAEEEDGYRDERGKFYGFAPDGLFTSYKKDGRYGLLMMSQFKDDDMIHITPPVYRKIEISHIDGSILYDIRGDEGYGMINFRGDTIVPPMYDKLEAAYLQDGMFIGAWLRKGRKKGLALECKGVVVPAIYDAVEDYTERESWTPMGLKVRSGEKLGFYAYDGMLVLPVVYDHILFRSASDDGGYNKVLQVLRDGKWQVQIIYVQFPEDFCLSSKPYFDPVDTNRFMNFDLVVNHMGFVNENGLYTQYDYLLSKEFSSKGMPEKEILLMNEGFDFFFENGRVGVKSSDGKVLVKPIFTNIRYLDAEHVIIVENGTELILDIYTQKRYKLEQW